MSSSPTRSKLRSGVSCYLLCFGAFVIFGGALFTTVKAGQSPANTDEASGRPRLAVIVCFDQMRADYLTRWENLYGKDGFRRLTTEGAWFQNCNYPYAYTVTAAGHASFATGCTPAKHGIIGNEWYDRRDGTVVSSVSSDHYEQVPPRASRGDKGAAKKSRGVSPERLLRPTLADALKKVTGSKSRVVSLSLKDRSAVLPGGQHPDACYWFDLTSGLFVTSTYYRDRLHPWVEAFNRSKSADHWVDVDWTKFRSDLDYVRYSGPDDVAGEGQGSFQGRTFPHPMSGNRLKLKSAYYVAVFDSPFGNDLLLELAKHAIEAEGLGTHDTPDLLCLSFSSNDAIGHTWGPDSQEVLDVTLRSDVIVKDLLSFLDTKVGKGRYVLALTADHGVCPLPEVARAQGKDAGRIPFSLLSSETEAFLQKKFGVQGDKGRWLVAVEGPWIYLNRETIRQHSLKEMDVEAALANWLRERPGIESVYTREQLTQGMAKNDTIGLAVQRSFYPDRSGDLFVEVKPSYLLWSELTGTTHGTPYPYDTHVPLLVFGPKVHAGIRQDKVSPLAVAPILGQALGIRMPDGIKAGVPDGLFDTSAP